MTALAIRVTPGRIANGRFRPSSEITDRAKRYRAAKQITNRAHCFSCGAKNPRDIAHIDGNESHDHPRNLAPQCRSCNMKFANTLHRAGVGKKTRQYNPARKVPAFGAYISSLQVLKGEKPGNVTSAIRAVQDVPPAKRSEYAKKVWDLRKKYYGPSGRKDGGATP